MKTLLSLLGLLGLTLFTSVAQADLKDDLASLQGTWSGKIETEQVTADITMEIKNNKATFTLKRDGQEYSFSADIKLEQVGKFKVFTYSNAETSSGEKLFEGETRSSIYRLDGSTLATAGGFSEGDDTPPSVIRWTKN